MARTQTKTKSAYQRAKHAAEAAIIAEAIERHGTRTLAARVLGITLQTIRQKIGASR